MSKPLFIKEVREVWWMGVAALVAVTTLVVDSVGIEIGPYGRIHWMQSLREAPFLQRDFAPAIGSITLCLGAALGVWQTLSESVTGSWTFLLHRPLSLKTIIATKLLAGISVVILGVGLPLSCYLLWAIYGKHGWPFEIWMMEDTLRFGLAGAAVYPAAFLCGIRPARIYASRLWPVVPAILVFAVQFDFEFFPTTRWCLVLFGVVPLLPAIFFAAENRDYA